MTLGERLGRASAPVVAGLIMLSLWEGALAITDPDGFVLPPPSDIVGALIENWDQIWAASRTTGFIIALAPIFNAWLGLLTARSNQVIVVILVFFPVFINTARGLTQVEPAQVELMESYAAGKWRITREVRIPNSLPYFFTALRLSSSLAVIAAIVAEYFGGRQDALGPIITQSAGLTRYDEAWAAVLAGTLIGGVLYLAVVTLERLAMPWHSSVRERDRIGT